MRFNISRRSVCTLTQFYINCRADKDECNQAFHNTNSHCFITCPNKRRTKESWVEKTKEAETDLDKKVDYKKRSTRVCQWINGGIGS